MNTYIISNITENLEYIEETKKTLKFAENASHVLLISHYLLKDSYSCEAKLNQYIGLKHCKKTLKWDNISKKYIKHAK